MRVSLGNLPQEVLHQVVIQLSAIDVATFEQVCHKFQDLCGPVLWRSLCKTYFKYWNQHHEFPRRLAASVDETDWKALFSMRFRLDNEIDRTIDDTLVTQSDRTRKVQYIVEHHWDAKDALLRNSNVGSDRHDVLARRWHSAAILGCLHRYSAIRRWYEMGPTSTDKICLEEALAAFDGFASHQDFVDIMEVSHIFDGIVDDFKKRFPDHDDLSTRKIGAALSQFVRTQNLVGLAEHEDVHYHDLQNNFIGHALRSERHSSLPLISVAIYCSIAKRLGLNANLCCFPFHVIAILRSGNQEPVYFDPFRTADEVPVSNLIAQLESMGAPQGTHEKLLGVASTAQIVNRCARNIITSIQSLPRGFATDLRPSTESAFYAALWVLLVAPTGVNVDGSLLQQAAYLPVIVNHMQAHFPIDIWLLQKYFAALFETIEHDTRGRLQSIRTNMDAPKQVKARTAEKRAKVRYRVGQVLRHKRYQYHAVVTGWDDRCAASDQWINQMRVHELPQGPNQSFYHVLVEDRTTRYVAEENIEILRQEPIPALLDIAGQFFKRWDEDSMTFISNVRDEYPDD